MPVLEADFLWTDNASTDEYRDDKEDGNTDDFDPNLGSVHSPGKLLGQMYPEYPSTLGITSTDKH